jgi:hypothetical protein
MQTDVVNRQKLAIGETTALLWSSWGLLNTEFFMRLVLACAAFLATSTAAFANDSEAELALGGLRLTQSDAISLEKEDLYISRDEVRVDYVFKNTSDKDVEILVAFPLPEQGFAEGDDSVVRNLDKDLNFKTTVDGKPVVYEVVTEALAGGEEISALLDKVGLTRAAQWKEGANEDASLASVDKAARDKLIALGALKNEGSEAEPFYMQKWVVRTSVTRKQTFKAGATVKVQHRYTPVAGGSVAGSLDAKYRNEDFAKEQIKKYCIEDSWLKSFDKLVAKHSKPENPAGYSEVWLGYVLKSGSNWKGPIKDFRLVVDKGKADSLVSFCAEGVKKISPTQFEVRKTNFEPDKDLDILVVDLFKPE